MNRFDRKAAEAGIKIDSRNGVPQENRNLRSITDLINAARAAEAELNNKLESEREARLEVERNLADERLTNQQLVAQMSDLKMELEKCKLRNKINENEFSVGQRRLLLGESSDVLAV